MKISYKYFYISDSSW